MAGVLDVAGIPAATKAMWSFTSLCCCRHSDASNSRSLSKPSQCSFSRAMKIRAEVKMHFVHSCKKVKFREIVFANKFIFASRPNVYIFAKIIKLFSEKANFFKLSLSFTLVLNIFSQTSPRKHFCAKTNIFRKSAKI